jgi:hypothetical protein
MLMRESGDPPVYSEILSAVALMALVETVADRLAAPTSPTGPVRDADKVTGKAALLEVAVVEVATQWITKACPDR